MRKVIFVIALMLSLSANADNIVFADANVKALCVANWDTNSDGELNEEEAAAVTSLGSVFREKTNITSFEELSYFTGLTAINDYAFYKSSIQKVAFPSSVTNIGQYAFAQSKISGELCIPGYVKDIDHYAFNACQSITRVVLEEGVETVGWHTFSGPIKSMLLPTTLTFMSSMAVDPYVNADPSSGIFVPDGDLYIYTHATTPAAINQFAYYYMFGDGHLVVPIGTIAAYKAEDGWAHFGEYLEFGDINMDGKIDNTDLGLIDEYLDGGAGDDFNKDIADTNGDGIVDEVDVQNISDIVDESTDISNIDDNINQRYDDKMYNLSGQVVGESYKGIVIKNGKKYIKR